MNQFTASLWGDEAWAATLAIKPYLQIIQIVSHDTSPPLFYLLLHTWMKIFGTSELAIRSLTFLFFLGTVFTTYLIASYLWDRKTGFLGAAITFLNPFLFQYGFEGRMYSLLCLTSTLSIYFFLKKDRLGFILATTAALYTHHFSLFVIIFEGFWTLLEGLRQPLAKTFKNLTNFLIIGLLYLPWLYPLYFQTSLVSSGFWLGKPQWADLRDLIVKFLVGPSRHLLENLALLAVLISLLLRRWLQDINKSFFLLGWFLVPPFLTYLVSQFFQPIFYDRYMLMVIPAVCLLLSSLTRRISLIPLILLIPTLVIIDWRYFTSPTKRPFRELANFVKQETNILPRVNFNAASHHLFESKYYGIPAPIYTPTSLPFYTGTALMEKGDIIDSLPQVPEILVIASEPPEKVTFPGWKQKKSQTFQSLSLVWLEKEGRK